MFRGGAAAAAENAHAAAGHLSGEGGKRGGRAVIHRLAVHCLGQAGIGFGNEGKGSVLPQAAELHQHGLRAGGAVEAEGIGAHGLHGHQGGQHVGAGQGTAVFIHSKCNKNGFRAHRADGQDGGPGLGQRHGGLHNVKIDSGLLQRCGLLGVHFHHFLKGKVADGRDELPGGGKVGGYHHIGSHGLSAQLHQPVVEFRHLVFQPIPGQLHPVGAEGGGVYNVAAGSGIVFLHLLQYVRVLQHPLLAANAGGHPQPLQHGAGGTIQNERQLHIQDLLMSVGCHLLRPRCLCTRGTWHSSGSRRFLAF